MKIFTKTIVRPGEEATREKIVKKHQENQDRYREQLKKRQKTMTNWGAYI
jgi:hypothetical protein